MPVDLKPAKFIAIERAYMLLLQGQDALSAAHVLLQQGDAPDEVVSRLGKTINRLGRSIDECYTGLTAAAASDTLADTLSRISREMKGEALKDDPQRDAIIDALRGLVASGKIGKSSAFAIELDKQGNVIGEPVAIGEDTDEEDVEQGEESFAQAHEAAVPQGDGEN